MYNFTCNNLNDENFFTHAVGFCAPIAFKWL